MFGLRLKWLIPFSLIAYVVYVITVVCPDPTASKLVVHQVTCDYINNKISPVISPYASQISTPLLQQYTVLDQKYKINEKLVVASDAVNEHYSQAVAHFDSKFKPLLVHYANELRFYTILGYNKVSHFLAPYVSCAEAKFKSSEFYGLYEQNDFNLYNTLYELFKQKSNYINNTINEKKVFLKKEWKNLYNSKFEKAPFQSNEGIADVVKDLLHEIESKTSEVKSVVSSLVLETISSVESSIVEPESSVVEPESSSEPEESVDLDSDDEPLTIHLTSTITVTQDSEGTDGVAVKDENNEVIQDSAEIRINEELSYWENKIKNFLQLSEKNLETEMEPILATIMDPIVKSISENLTEIQQEIHLKYKEMNQMISQIHKDAEEIETTNEVPEEFEVPRQLIRDKIKACYDLPENSFKDIEVILNDVNSQILTKYFEVIQETIDIVESFADNSIQEFSSRLTNLIEYLQDASLTNKLLFVDDELNFRAWKKFHKIKEEIFTARDTIFNDANDYKENLSKSTKKPRGLEKWISYLKNINFHINFLLRDNDDYLKLIRARANVAFQLREGLERDLASAAEAKQELERQEELKRQAEKEEEEEEAEEAEEELSEEVEEEAEEEFSEEPSEEEYITVTKVEVLSDDDASDEEDLTTSIAAVPSQDPLHNDVELDSELDVDLEVNLD